MFIFKFKTQNFFLFKWTNWDIWSIIVLTTHLSLFIQLCGSWSSIAYIRKFSVKNLKSKFLLSYWLPFLNFLTIYFHLFSVNSHFPKFSLLLMGIMISQFSTYILSIDFGHWPYYSMPSTHYNFSTCLHRLVLLLSIYLLW